MKTKNIIKTTSLLAMMSLSMTSCSDWLEVLPQTQIVEENFWEDKNDLDGVRYGVYKKMSQQVSNMIVWGDLRAADIYTLPSNQSSSQTNRNKYAQIMQANIDTTWSEYDWSEMYSAIGYCNKVLYNGEKVLERDKQFTAAEWRQMKAEMVTMRALGYFYMVRAFKSIPYTTKIINSDTDVEYFPQLPVLDVMDSLIADVESIKGQARNRFVDKKETKGQITNTAVYALLSDMYLWRASLREGRMQNDTTITLEMVADDYQKCILYSEKSVAKLAEQFEEETKNFGIKNSNDYMSWAGAPTFDGKEIRFMYRNNVEEANRGFIDLNAYNQIFGKGNSYESIFELQFNKNDSRSNGAVNAFWGASEGAQLVSTLTKPEKNNDARYWFSGWQFIEGMDNSFDPYCIKWAKADPIFKNNLGTTEVEIYTKVEVEDYNNWIIYRLSDVLLQNAEARACLAKLGVDAAENKKVCLQLLRMVNRRWWVDVVNGGNVDNDVSVKKDYDIYTNGDIKDVMNTRKIELIGEGKRWFDLVRYAERLSASDDAVEGKDAAYNDFLKSFPGQELAQSRCETLWGMYSPIYYMECKAYRAGGYNFTQNPVWNKSKYDR